MTQHPFLRFVAIAFIIALLGAALGLGFFREIDGQNLRSLIQDNIVLQQPITAAEQHMSELSAELAIKEVGNCALVAELTALRRFWSQLRLELLIADE